MNLGIATDLSNTNFAGASNPDDQLWVRFESRKYEIKHKSEKEGHPVFEMRDFVVIQAPGDQLNIRNTLVTEEHKRRFPRQWAHYQNTKQNETPQGWLLEAWPAVNAAQVEELKYRKVFTVEQLAEMSFGLVQKLGMGYVELQTKAKAAVVAAKDGAIVQAQAVELKKRDEQISAQQAQLDAMAKQMQELSAKVQDKPRRGRPPLNKDLQQESV